MGVLNVTPDSFSDGGLDPTVEHAIERGLRLAEAGADIVDVGGESTRPGAVPVDPTIEAERVVPVIRALVERGVLVSVDTRRASVARAACAVGAHLVNDVGGLRDPAMMEVVAEHGVAVCVMHMQGEPSTMQLAPRYDSVVDEVSRFLELTVQRALAEGISRDRIVVDPGMGFGKRHEDNLALLSSGDRLRDRTGCAVLIGASRKSFLGRLTDRSVGDRDVASAAAATAAILFGANLIRAHDIGAHRDAARVADALRARS